MDDTFYKNLSKLRSAIKERRQKELHELIDNKNNDLEDKIALIKLSLKEIETNELASSFSELMKKESDK